jgi:hypothetical protein
MKERIERRGRGGFAKKRRGKTLRTSANTFATSAVKIDLNERD